MMEAIAQLSPGLLTASDDFLPSYPNEYPPAAVWDALSPRDIRRAWTRAAQSGRALSLYVHLPFCRKICRFCGIMYRKKLASSLEMDRYLQALTSEAKLWSTLLKKSALDCVFLGGGTPTLLTEKQLTELLGELFRRFRRGPRTGLAVEANPESLTREKLEALAGLGLTYLSLGMQSLDDAVLSVAQRPHTASRARESFHWARKKTLAWINIDLMAGLEAQSRESFLRDLETAASWRPDSLHVSTFSPTRFTLWAKSKSPTGPEEGSAWPRWISEGFELLSHRDYRRVSEFRAVRRSGLRGRLAGQEGSGDLVLGLGVGAISHAGRRLRTQNAETLADYQDAALGGRLPVARGCVRTGRQERIAFLLSSWGRREVVDPAEFRREFGEDAESLFGDRLAALEATGVLRRERGKYVLAEHPAAELEIARAFYEDAVVRRLAEKFKVSRE